MKLRNYSIISNRDVIEETYKNTDSYYAHKCDEFLRNNGFAPVYVDGDFPYLNVFANFAFYSGCVAKKEVKISEDEKTLDLLEKNITKKLGLKTKVIPQKGGRGASLTLIEGGPYIARLLQTLGLPRSSGSKARLKSLEIPSYREDLFKFATCDILDDNDRETVRRVEYDSAAVLFSTRMSVPSENHWVIYSFARPTEEEARSFTEKNVEMINFAVPGLEISDENIKIQKLRSGSYSPRIIIKGRNKECISDAHQDLLKFSPHLQMECGFDMKKLKFEPLEL
jgi:hypothetical protein